MRSWRSSSSVRALVLLLAGWGGVARAGVEAPDPRAERPTELQGADIEDRLGNRLPLDASLIDETGAAITLGKYFPAGGTKPVLLTLGYYECPMLCSLVLNGVVQALQDVSLVPGRDYTVVSISIEPKDTVELAAAKRQGYLEKLQRPGGDEGWHFHVGDPREVRKIAEAVGFGYKFDENSQQWAHGAGIFFLSPQGVLTRTLWGLEYKPTEVKFALMDASQGRVGSAVDRILLSCFRYDSAGHKYNLYVWGIMRLAGAAMVLVMGVLLARGWRRDVASGRQAQQQRT